MVRKHDPKAAHLRVRLDGKLLRQIEKAALQNNRPMNAEIVERLERSFAKEDTAELINQAVRASLDRFTLLLGEHAQRDVKETGRPLNDAIMLSVLIES